MKRLLKFSRYFLNTKTRVCILGAGDAGSGLSYLLLKKHIHRSDITMVDPKEIYTY